MRPKRVAQAFPSKAQIKKTAAAKAQAKTPAKRPAKTAAKTAVKTVAKKPAAKKLLRPAPEGGPVRLLIVAVGQRLPDWAQSAWADYAKRFPAELKVELKAVKTEPRGSRSLPSLLAAERSASKLRCPRAAVWWRLTSAAPRSAPWRWQTSCGPGSLMPTMWRW